mmetsp:Transcript_44157/g.58594  ORF Transcript_44157/g.58594 Transcript_44157/m.58594 type:complete len:214 (+) Transcript_44157:548-1189(+)
MPTNMSITAASLSKPYGYDSILSPTEKDAHLIFTNSMRDHSVAISKPGGKNSASHFTKMYKKLSCPSQQASGAHGSKSQHKRTLLFDLDETLIHCVDDCSDPSTYEHLVEIKITKNAHVRSSSSTLSSHSRSRTRRQVTLDSKNQLQSDAGANQVIRIAKAGINIRPYAVETLRECEKMGFEVGIFTASHQQYADAVLDKLIDPERKYPRLYR